MADVDYASADDLQGYLSQLGDDDLPVAEKMLTRASRAIDAYTRRPENAFAPAADSASEMIVYGADSPVLMLTEFVPASVETVTAPTGYMPEAWREWRRKEVSTGAARVGLHTATSAGILTPRVVWQKGVPFTVKARWGFVATPANVTEACLQLVTRWWRAKDEGFSGVVGSLGADRSIMERGFPPGVKTLLEPYVLAEEVSDEDSGTIERGELIDADHNPWRNF